MNSATATWLCGLAPGMAIGFCIGWGIAQREIAFLQTKMIELLDMLGKAIEVLTIG
jgi:hypothetical protein